MKRKLVIVTWRDAVSNHAGWATIADVEKQKAPVVKSVGWVVRRTPRELTLVASVMDLECSQDVTIPIGWIISERELTVKT